MINSIPTITPNLANAEKTLREEQVNEIKEAYKNSKEKQFVQVMTQVQSSLGLKVLEGDKSIDEVQEFKDFLNDIGYEGKPIASLSQEEAAELVSEDGFFGVKQTSDRIAQFVILGAGGEEELLREGKKGMLQGFDQAEKMWGGKLPDIAYETIKKAVEMIDQALVDNGFTILDEKA